MPYEDPLDPILDSHNRTFESESMAVPHPPRASEYRRMLDHIISLFPQAQGTDSAVRFARSEFESVFPNSTIPDPIPPLPKLSVYQRVATALSDADERLHKNVHGKKMDKSLLPRRKPIYAPSGLPAEGRAVPVNEAFESLLSSAIKEYRDASISIGECLQLESTFRSHLEVISHCMWTLTGLLGLIKQEGYLPNDRSLFDQMVSSLSIGLAHQANMAAAGTSFMVLKRREVYVSRLQPIFPASIKSALLGSPTCSSDTLFHEAELSRLLELANSSSSFKSNQAMLDIAASAVGRSRSPRRSSPRSPRFRRRSPPSRSPKRVRFSGTPPPPPAAKSSPKQ